MGMKLRKGEVKIQEKRGNVSKCKYLEGSFHLFLPGANNMSPGTLRRKIKIRWAR